MNTNTKTKQESHIGSKNAKTVQYKNIAVKTQRYRIISDYGKISKIKMQRKMENHRSPKKIYKNTLKKQPELPFANMKQNMHLTEFTTTGLKKVNTEFKLYTIGHNLKKRIYTTK